MLLRALASVAARKASTESGFTWTWTWTMSMWRSRWRRWPYDRPNRNACPAHDANSHDANSRPRPVSTSDPTQPPDTPRRTADVVGNDRERVGDPTEDELNQEPMVRAAMVGGCVA